MSTFWKRGGPVGLARGGPHPVLRSVQIHVKAYGKKPRHRPNALLWGAALREELPCSRGFPEARAVSSCNAGSPMRSARSWRAPAVHQTRRAVEGRLVEWGVPVDSGSGGGTKFNKTAQHLPQSPLLVAACSWNSGTKAVLSAAQSVLGKKVGVAAGNVPAAGRSRTTSRLRTVCSGG